MKACECNESLGNTGVPGCQPINKVVKKLILVPTYANDGTINKLDITDNASLTAAAVEALINEVDPSKRWYPTEQLENVVTERGETTYETAPSGRKAFVKQGTRNFKGEFWNMSSEYKEQLDRARCVNFSAWLIDLDGNLRGMVKEGDTEFMYPIKIDNNSFNVDLMFGTDDAIEKLVINFDWAQDENDASLRTINNSDFEADLLEIEGLKDVTITYGALSDTSITFTLKTKYGSVLDPVKVQGLVATDFYDSVGGAGSKLYNNTDSLAVSILSLSESTGVYTVTFATQDSADIIKVIPVKNGYDFTAVHSNTVAIP